MDNKLLYRFAIGGKLILFKYTLFILVSNRVIVIENGQKNCQLQLQLSTFENSQLQQKRVINYNYNFSEPACDALAN